MGNKSSKGWCVYILRCADGTLYCGATNDLQRRIGAHNAGRGAKYTRGRTPVKLKFSKHAGSRSAAQRLEARIKAMSRPEKIELIKGRGA